VKRILYVNIRCRLNVTDLTRRTASGGVVEYQGKRKMAMFFFNLLKCC
jgi:hypothetical protein